MCDGGIVAVCFECGAVSSFVFFLSNAHGLRHVSGSLVPFTCLHVTLSSAQGRPHVVA